MKTSVLETSRDLALVVGGILAIGPVMADKPSWAGGGQGGKEDRVERRDGDKGGRNDREGGRRDDGEKHGQGAGKSRHFEDRQQAMVRDYYAAEFQRGRCPPGLAKKHNGCMPPGQAKKWQMGQPLPRGLI